MAIPIILCGKEGSLSSDVQAGLKPEYEVIFFAQGHAQAKEKIPQEIQKAKAIVVGRGFTKEVQDAIVAASGDHKIQWLVADESKPVENETAEGLIARGKAVLDDLKAKGKLDDGSEGTTYF